MAVQWICRWQLGDKVSMISRRSFLCGTAASALLAGFSYRSEARLLRGGFSSGSSFNGGLTQFNTTTPLVGNDYPWLNLVKASQAWSYNSSPGSQPNVPIAELDDNGYPTEIVAGTNGVYTVFPMPINSQYALPWTLRWDGNGTLDFGNLNISNPSGSLTSTTGSGEYVFTRGDNNSGLITFRITDSDSSNHVRNIRLCKSAYVARLDAGEQFDPDSLALIKSAKPGVVRSLGWGGIFMGTNESQITKWDSRMPKSYWSYGSQYNTGASYGGVTTNSGSDFSLSVSSFSLVDKAQVTLFWNTNAPQSGSTTINTATTSDQPISFPWTSHGLAVGNAVCFGNSGAQPDPLVAAQTYYIIASGFSADSFEVSATPGGSAVLATSTAPSVSFQACSVPRLNINGTGFVPITGNTVPFSNNVFIGYNTQLPATGLASVVYDATSGWFWNANGGYISGVPPETFIDYCAEIGAHPHLVTPYLSVEPTPSDFMIQWANYATSTYPWMKPRTEPPNETWNTGFLSTQYAKAIGNHYWGLLDGAAWDNAYAKWCSTIGQAMSAQYGNDRTKYSMVCGVQSSSAHDNGLDADRLTASYYVSQDGGSPAYLWVDRVCTANYYSPSERYTCGELIDAFAYSVTYSGNPSQQATIANNYVATSSSTDTPFTLQWDVTAFTNLKNWAQGMPSGSTVKGMTCYEGGYSPDYLAGDWSTDITGATQADPCVLTLATTSQNSEQSGMSGNPATVGMMLRTTSIVGMTQLNCSSSHDSGGSNAFFTTNSATINWSPANPLIVGQCVTFNSDSIFEDGINPLPQLNAAPAPLVAGQPYYVVAVGSGTLQVSATKGGSAITITDTSNLSASVNSGWMVTNVSGNSITIDVNSLSFSAYSSGGQATYDNSQFYSNVLRQAGALSTQCGAMNTALYNDLSSLSASGFVFEYPSNFLYTGTGTIWPVLNPGIYASLTPQWESIVAWNNP